MARNRGGEKTKLNWAKKSAKQFVEPTNRTLMLLSSKLNTRGYLQVRVREMGYWEGIGNRKLN